MPRMTRKLHHFAEHPGEVFATWGKEVASVALA